MRSLATFVAVSMLMLGQAAMEPRLAVPPTLRVRAKIERHNQALDCLELMTKGRWLAEAAGREAFAEPVSSIPPSSTGPTCPDAGRSTGLHHRVGQTIRQAVRQLADAPGLGRPGRIPGTRELVVPGTSYIVPYRARSDAIEIILHGAQRWPDRLP